MRRAFAVAAVLASGTATGTAQPDTVQWSTESLQPCSLSWSPADSIAVSAIREDLPCAVSTIRAFFGRTFRTTFSVFVYPSRNALDHQWQLAWRDSAFHSECWMVASGVADRLDILSPRTWGAEACEHNGQDSVELQRIITHEFVHVLHGQLNPQPDLAGLDSLAWFVEGLATYASGQLTEDRTRQVSKLAADGKGPTRLAGFWRGQAKYGNAGSMVRFIDRTYGREKIIRMLGMTDQRDMLNLLDTDEQSLVAGWRASLE